MTTLTFQNKTLSVINQNNQMWITVTEIGNALGYSDPFKSVKNIYDRHQDEFTPCMTALIDTQTNGGIQKMRIFSLRGAHLIAMFARTKVAKDFRKWVLDILDREVSTGTISPEQQQAIQSAVQQAHHRTGLHWQEIYRQIKAIFHVAKYDQLPVVQFGNVMAFITNLQKTEQTAPLALPNKSKISVELNHYLELAHLARTASSTCWHLMDTHKKALEAFGFAFSPINSLSIQAELVEKMQFVLDDVETNHRNYLKQQKF